MHELTDKQINAAVQIVLRVAHFRELPAYMLRDLEREAQKLAREIEEPKEQTEVRT